jgi:starch phosphorylase
MIAVEIYADPVDGAEPVRHSLERAGEIPGTANAWVYRGRIPGSSRPASHFTPRIVPYHAESRVPIEAPLIRWCDERTWGVS